MPTVYKILHGALWAQAQQRGELVGMPVDLADGYIHFSTSEQVRETAARHFKDQDGLMLLAIDAESLGPALRWEPSRHGALFPHLYAPLRTELVRWARDLPRGADGALVFPPLDP